MSKKSSHRWRREQQTDPYIQQAQKEGYRSRAVFKLEQINARDHLLRPGMTVVDLGAAPGGWSQWVHKQLQEHVTIIALDILPMEPLAGVTFLQGDFREEGVLNQLMQILDGRRADLVMSDMAPNISGIKAVDQPRAMLLNELARDLALDILAPKGCFLTKLFQGEGSDAFIRSLRPHFDKLVTRKPDASRARSPEVYLLAKEFKSVKT